MPKLAGQLSQKNVKNSQVRRHKKLPETRRSAVTKYCHKLTGPPVMEKYQNFAGLRSQVHCHRKLPKTYRSAITKNCKKLAGPQSRKIQKCIGQQLCKIAKNSHVHCHKKYQKFACPRSRKNVKNLSGSRSEKIPKICRSGKNAKNLKGPQPRKNKKCIGQQLCKNDNNS